MLKECFTSRVWPEGRWLELGQFDPKLKDWDPRLRTLTLSGQTCLWGAGECF